jgi:hypothetical protein
MGIDDGRVMGSPIRRQVKRHRHSCGNFLVPFFQLA